MWSLLDRPRRRRRSPSPHRKFRSSTVGLGSHPVRKAQGVTVSLTFSISSPLQQPSTLSSRLIQHRCSSRRLAVRFLICSPPSPNFSPCINPVTLQRCTLRGQLSMLRARSFTCCRSSDTSLSLLRVLLGFKSSEQLLLPQHPDFLAAPPTVLSDCAHLFAETHVRKHPFSATSMACQAGASAWFISTVLWVCLDILARLWPDADCVACCSLFHL